MTNNTAFWVQEQEKKTIHKLYDEKHNKINVQHLELKGSQEEL